MDLDPVDFFPGYDPCRCVAGQRRRRQESCSSNFWTNLLTVALSIMIGVIGFYFIIGKDIFDNWKIAKVYDADHDVIDPLQALKEEVKMLKGKLDQTDIWRKHLEDLYTKIYHKQESIFENKLARAIDLYDTDKIGLFDYAAVYASGSIYSTPLTHAYPINKTITFFSLLNLNIFSNPLNLLQANNLPGNCFAFKGTEGRIRIKLGQNIIIKAVTMDHIKLYEDRGSAPKDFEVYGLRDPDEESRRLLGSFTYDITDRACQTFPVQNNHTFSYVELHILNNYGKEEYTCVYRFRVHNVFVKRL